MTGCTLRMQQSNETVTLQVLGEGRMTDALPLRHYVERCFAAGTQAIEIDLRHCTYLDSTFLGTLLRLQRAAAQMSRRVVLLSPSPPCVRLLRELGIDRLLQVESADEREQARWQQLEVSCDDSNDLTLNVVEAHRELGELGGTAGRRFKSVARCLEEDWQQHQEKR